MLKVVMGRAGTCEFRPALTSHMPDRTRSDGPAHKGGSL